MFVRLSASSLTITQELHVTLLLASCDQYLSNQKLGVSKAQTVSPMSQKWSQEPITALKQTSSSEQRQLSQQDFTIWKPGCIDFLVGGFPTHLKNKYAQVKFGSFPQVFGVKIFNKYLKSPRNFYSFPYNHGLVESMASYFKDNDPIGDTPIFHEKNMSMGGPR